MSSTVMASPVCCGRVALFAGSCLRRVPAFELGEEGWVSLCWLGVTLPTMLLAVTRGRLKSKLSPFSPAAVLLTFGRPKVNIEDVVGGSGRLPEVGGKDAPVIVLANEV